MKTITVIGGGFSGLTLARALLKEGAKVVLIEKENRCGGLIRTRRLASGLAESAASSISRTARVDRLLEELRLPTLVPDKASNRKLFYVGRPRRWPLGVFETLHVVWKYVAGKVKRRLPPLPGESVSAWGGRCLTKPATEKLLAAGLQGIYAGDIDRMSASLVLGPMFRRDRDRYLGLAGLQGGMGVLIEALKKDILARGGEIRESVEISGDNLPTPCALAVPAPEAARLLRAQAPALAERISRIRYAPLVAANLFFEEDNGQRAFGCLVPRGQGLRTLGVLFHRCIFPTQDRLSCERWILGGATDPAAADLSAEGLRELIRTERRRILGLDDQPVESEIAVWKQGLPHYDLTLEKILEDLPEPEGIWLHGNWLGGIGLSRILERSENLAKKIVRESA
ncbi:MAG: FAD-dependent oxidoreductase [Bdellovibrionaceae bacterium]|nr:FAD-dependent oxidoreductase [Pseudobdellovibrionaceae bacterium]